VSPVTMMLLRCIMRSMWILGCEGVGVMVMRRRKTG
jgi:hypothetical protein